MRSPAVDEPCPNFSQSLDETLDPGRSKRGRNDVSFEAAQRPAEPALDTPQREHLRKSKKINPRPRDKAFNCTVHGHVELHPTLWKIIDTPEYQRLRRCKQLGHASLVFQNATHTRFEHSLGVAYKAGRVVRRIQERFPPLKVTNKDKLCVEIAALVHDLGHGPFSHQFEHVLHDYGKELQQRANATAEDIRKAECLSEWTHEEQSIKMFDYLLQANDIDLSKVENGALDQTDVIFIKELINGAPLISEEEKKRKKERKRTERDTKQTPNVEALEVDAAPKFMGRGPDKIFLYEIVSNKRTGLDVDRLDYLQRDMEAAIGIKTKQFEKLGETVAVCTDDNNKRVLAYPEEQVQSVMQLYQTRMKMYTEVYMHRKVLIMDEMVKDILLLARNAIRIPVRNRLTGKLEYAKGLIDLICENDLAAFSQLDDSILDLIRLSDSDTEDMAKASELINRLQKRDLYVMAGNLCIKDKGDNSCMDKNNEQNIKHAAQRWTTDHGAWRTCSSSVHKHRALWAHIDEDAGQVLKDIVQFVQPETQTPPEEEVPDSAGEEEGDLNHENPITCSQYALEEAEKARQERKGKQRAGELQPDDLRLKKYTVSTGGGGDKFSDPVQHVWFYNNDASEYDAFEEGQTKPHRVDPEHYKMSMPASFCSRELKVLCTDRKKIKMAETAVNKFCEFMNMPKALNQSSQILESPQMCLSAGQTLSQQLSQSQLSNGLELTSELDCPEFSQF